MKSEQISERWPGARSENAVEQQKQRMVELVTQWRQISAQLQDYKNHRFQVGSKVQVNDPRFQGVGVVTHEDATPADKLAVILESGNTWWYPLENCTRL